MGNTNKKNKLNEPKNEQNNKLIGLINVIIIRRVIIVTQMLLSNYYIISK